MARTATISRVTDETNVQVELNIDGTGVTQIDTGVRMYDHLLTSFGLHGSFDLEIRTVGDLHIDEHHTVEDTAIALGEAFDAALGDRSGITRFSDAVLSLPFIAPSIGTLGTQMIPHALEAFASSARMTMHISS